MREFTRRFGLKWCTGDQGLGDLRFPPRRLFGAKAPGGGFGAQAQYKSSVGPLFTNKARVVIAREQKGEEERRAVD